MYKSMLARYHAPSHDGCIPVFLDLSTSGLSKSIILSQIYALVQAATGPAHVLIGLPVNALLGHTQILNEGALAYNLAPW